MFTVTTHQHGVTLSTHKAPTLDAAHLDILTDALPASMTLREAVSLLGEITGEGGRIVLTGGVVIDVTREDTCT